MATIDVYRRPSVAIVSTGNELVEQGRDGDVFRFVIRKK